MIWYRLNGCKCAAYENTGDLLCIGCYLHVRLNVTYRCDVGEETLTTVRECIVLFETYETEA